jgi:hypothetical protein
VGVFVVHCFSVQNSIEFYLNFFEKCIDSFCYLWYYIIVETEVLYMKRKQESEVHKVKRV